MYNKTLFAALFCVSASISTAKADEIQSNEGTYKWSGPYVGASIGVQSLRAKDEFSDATKYDGSVGGIYAGYNFRIDHMLLGVEVDAMYSTIDEINSFGNELETGFQTAAKVKAGFVHDRFALYGIAGVIAAKAEFGRPARGISDSNRHFGYTLGAGVEAFITESISARLEYQHTELNKQTYNIGGIDFEAEGDANSVSLGFSYHF